MFAKNSSINANLILICLATGFFTKKIIMRIKRNGRVLDEDDGLKSSGVVLNSDNSFKRRDQVEILKSDVAEYSCEVILEEFNVRVTKDWGKNLFIVFVNAQLFCSFLHHLIYSEPCLNSESVIDSLELLRMFSLYILYDKKCILGLICPQNYQ